MISTRHRFIYLHIPKTGGNAIQNLLLPFSDDTRLIRGHQDGVHRYELTGLVTPRKHANLQEYADILGHDALAEYRIVISVRHPFERAVSAYFSPHRWMRQNGDGRWFAMAPTWRKADFFKMLRDPLHGPACDYLRVDGEVRRPDHTLRNETLSQDVFHMMQTLKLPGIPAQSIDLPRLNVSAAPTELYQSVLDDAELRHEVEALYAEDMAYFAYAKPPQP